MKLIGVINQFSLSFSEFWAARGARERTMLAAGALVVISGLFYILLVDPALTGRQQMQDSLPVQRQQVAQMREMAKEAAALAGKPAAPRIVLSNEMIASALARHGLKPKSVMLAGDQAKVQLAAVSFSGMLNWLTDIQRGALLSVSDANIVALAQPDMVDATITLRLPSHE